MIAHRVMWLFACGLSVASGLAVSLTWPATSVLALFLACVLLAGMVTIHYNLLTIDPSAPSPLHIVMANVVTFALVGGVVMVGFVALAGSVGVWVLLVCILLVGSSPTAVRFYRRRFTGDGVDTGDRLRSDDPPRTEHEARAVDLQALRLTDEELCQAWRSSFHALRAATSPTLQARIVETRRVYLDELARRSAVGLNEWISPGTGVPADADPAVSPGARDDEIAIDWDALLDQDDPWHGEP